MKTLAGPKKGTNSDNVSMQYCVVMSSPDCFDARHCNQAGLCEHFALRTGWVRIENMAQCQHINCARPTKRYQYSAEMIEISCKASRRFSCGLEARSARGEHDSQCDMRACRGRCAA